MTDKQKQLILTDLCARLPYGLKVKCERYPFPVTVLYAGNVDEVKFKETGGIEHIDIIKPYLRPMSRMTKEEKDELNSISYEFGFEWIDAETAEEKYIASAKMQSRSIDFYNAHHLDYGGLIPMGLALEAPEGMYKEITL